VPPAESPAGCREEGGTMPVSRADYAAVTNFDGTVV